MSAIDFLLSDDGDLFETATGQWVDTNSDGQHVHDILQLEPGELVTDPLIGVGIERNINGNVDGSLKKNIYLQLQADGYRVNLLSVDENGNIEIDVERES
jgi:hypothetical protein